ncbi:MAG TPA: endonuclease/exonuclease/phosphatase family protein [Tepidisphaeraceae bacterium]|nr:endonuclease/exonuclease/phosphatase family protein [Tepidisphaeraceae bacterium]
MAVLLCLAIGAALIEGNIRWPLGAAGGESLNGPPAPGKTGNRIRLGTFNIHGGRDPNDRPDLPQVVHCVAGCDLLALNEIHGGSLFSRTDQAELIARALGQPWLFAATERRWWRDDFGNAIVTSLPVRHWQRFPISPAGARSNRNLLLSRIDFAGASINVLMTHLGRQGDNALELRTVIELFKSLSEPAILMGDLNKPPDDPQIKALIEDPAIVDAVGRSPQAGKGHIDYILLRGMRYVDSGMIDDGTSDHPFYWADVEVPPRNASSQASQTQPSQSGGPQ